MSAAAAGTKNTAVPGFSSSRCAPRVETGVERTLGNSLVTRCRNESGELRIGDGMRIYPEVTDRHHVDRRFIRIGLVGAHSERAASDPSHTSGRSIGTGPQSDWDSFTRSCTISRRAPLSFGGFIGIVF